ncbi:MAG: T9SS type A sorting domain-containing protein, partial [Candidatus Krumholzibacteria bacterium]|nr:T9SS type A sorting domain-containing protein [Candidatus Krumholzibacteria bacterium]
YTCVFLSADGDEWTRLKTDYGLMVEPIIVAKTPEMMGLKMMAPDEEETPVQDTPKVTGLKAPFPNPCNPITTIEFSLAKPQIASLKVFDIRGRLVRTLVHGEHAAGRYVVEWRGRDNRGAGVASGVYFVKMETDTGQWSHRLVLLK